MKTLEHKLFYPTAFLYAANVAERYNIPYLPAAFYILGLAGFVAVIVGYFRPSQIELMSQLEEYKKRYVYSLHRLAHPEPGDNTVFYQKMVDTSLERITELKLKIAQMDEIEIVADDK